MSERQRAKSVLWYDRPAGQWREALPVGNGRLGAMVFGGAPEERIQLNEETVWTGGPYDPARPGGPEALPEIRRLVFAGEHLAAQYLFAETMMGKPWGQMKYQPLADLLIRFAGAAGTPGSARGRTEGAGETEEYRRELDLESAVATVRYRAGGVVFTREVFASAVDQVICVRLSADRPGAISFAARLRGGQEGKDPGDAAWTCGVAAPDELVITGRTASYCGIEGRVRYESRVRVANEGGKLAVRADAIEVGAADAVTLLVAAATNFVDHRDLGGDPARRVRETLDAVAGRSYEAVRADHEAEHARLFGRVGLELGGACAGAGGNDVPTDRRIAERASRDDPALDALLFQYGRYLLVSSSRPPARPKPLRTSASSVEPRGEGPGCQPANLQGMWNEDVDPAWDSKFTSNINLEMNYWPAEVASLPECVEPLVAMVEGLAETGARIAELHYGAAGTPGSAPGRTGSAGGWVFHQNTDLWRAAHPMDGPPWGTWPTGGAWLCHMLREHYEFGRDRAFLERIYPLLKGAARFFLDTLVEHPESGRLVTCPSSSPENFPAYPGNGMYMDRDLKFQMPGTTICAGPTMDMAILRDLFADCIDSSEVLGVDEELRAEWARTRERLAPLQVGRKGNLQEWLEDVEDLEHEHRHLSHLYAAYPGDAITPGTTPALARAVAVTLDERGDGGPGFSRAWKVALWARLGEGERALSVLRGHTSEVTCPNGLSTCFGNPQVDGTFGGTAAVAEMLIQSHGGVVRLLPALPDSWSDGSFAGLRARGGFTVDCSWRSGRAERATVRAGVGTSCRLRAPRGQRVSGVTRDGEAVAFAEEGGAAVFEAEPGGRYDIAFERAEPPERASALPSAAVTPTGRALYQADFPAEELAARRSKVMDAIGPAAHALVVGAGGPYGLERFRQDDGFYYLTGIEEPQAYLLIAGADRTSRLYLRSRAPGQAQHGDCLAVEDARLVARLTGVDSVHGIADLAAHLEAASTLHAPSPGGAAAAREKRVAADPWDDIVTRQEHIVDRVRARLPGIELRDLTPVLNGLRLVKSPREVALMREAGRLSALAVTEAMRATRPGRNERHLEAIALAVFTAGGARGAAYPSIIASGANIRHNHYSHNCCELREGELVLMDAAPDYRRYTSDIGRMWPVSGRYSQWQRELYGFVVEYHRTLLALVRPGATSDAILAEAAGRMSEVVERTAFTKRVYREAAKRMLERKWLLSHPVGLSVHDPGDYREGPLEPGTVFSVDPEMFVPEERLYIRVEDTVAVTEDSVSVLTADAPLGLDETERTMREEGAFARALGLPPRSGVAKA